MLYLLSLLFIAIPASPFNHLSWLILYTSLRCSFVFTLTLVRDSTVELVGDGWGYAGYAGYAKRRIQKGPRHRCWGPKVALWRVCG